MTSTIEFIEQNRFFAYLDESCEILQQFQDFETIIDLQNDKYTPEV